MDKNYLIQLTNEIYRITLLFPKKEPLRYKMRELADDIMAKCQRISAANNPASLRSVAEDLEILDSFFEVAKNQNWVSPAEMLKLQEDYGKIKKELAAPDQVIITSPPQPEIKPDNSAEARQQKILEILKERGRAQVWEIQKIFPNVTKRTLRRDFRHLLKNGAVERLGERNETFYQPKH